MSSKPKTHTILQILFVRCERMGLQLDIKITNHDTGTKSVYL